MTEEAQSRFGSSGAVNRNHIPYGVTFGGLIEIYELLPVDKCQIRMYFCVRFQDFRMLIKLTLEVQC